MKFNKSTFYALVVIFVTLTPIFTTAILLKTKFDTTIFDYHMQGYQDIEIGLPIVLSDEVYHWHQARTFAKAGVSGGFYTLNEMSAKIDLSHFYAWGMFPPALYGSIGKIVGFEAYSIILFNLIFLCMSIALAIYVLRPTILGLFLLGLLLASYPSLIIFSGTSFLQLLNLSIAVFLGSMFYYLLKNQENFSVKIYVLIVFSLILFSLLRVTWSFLFFPLFIIAGWRFGQFKGLILSLFLGAFFVTLLFAFYSLSASPYPNITDEVLIQLPNLYHAVEVIAKHSRNNISNLFDTKTIEIIPRIQILLIMSMIVLQFISQWMKKWQLNNLASLNELFFYILNVVVISIFAIIVYKTGFSRFLFIMLMMPLYFMSWWRKKWQLNNLASFNELFLHILNVVVIIILAIMIYEIGGFRDFRLILPHILLSLIVLIGFKRYSLVILIVAINIFSLTLTIDLYTEFSEPHYVPQLVDLEEIEQIYNQNGVVFDNTQSDGWCNTVLHHYSYLRNPIYLVSLDAGIGISWFKGLADVEPISRYILLPDDFPPPIDWTLEPLIQFEHATLFMNPNANCQ